MTVENPIPVVVNGAAGKMGREVIKAVSQAEDMMLVGAVDKNPNYRGQDVGEVAGGAARRLGRRRLIRLV